MPLVLTGIAPTSDGCSTGSARNRPTGHARPVAGLCSRREGREVHPMAIGDAPGVAAGRVADDVGRIGAGPAAAGGGVGLEALRIQALGREYPPLPGRPAHGVVADHPVAANHAVARHARHGVVRQRGAHGVNRPRLADLGRDPAVRPDLAARESPRMAWPRRIVAWRRPRICNIARWLAWCDVLGSRRTSQCGVRR